MKSTGLSKKNLYTYCKIRFVDDGTEQDVIIKANNEVVEVEDDLIFFYGLSLEQLQNACKTQKVLEGEWTVVSIHYSSPELI